MAAVVVWCGVLCCGTTYIQFTWMKTSENFHSNWIFRLEMCMTAPSGKFPIYLLLLLVIFFFCFASNNKQAEEKKYTNWERSKWKERKRKKDKKTKDKRQQNSLPLSQFTLCITFLLSATIVKLLLPQFDSNKSVHKKQQIPKPNEISKWKRYAHKHKHKWIGKSDHISTSIWSLLLLMSFALYLISMFTALLLIIIESLSRSFFYFLFFCLFSILPLLFLLLFVCFFVCFLSGNVQSND